jgi:hypothetical protein
MIGFRAFRIINSVITIIGIIFLVLGIYFISSYINNYYNLPHFNSAFEIRYFIAGILGIVVGLRMLWYIIPILMPVRKETQSEAQTCPFCGAIVEDNSTKCKKCGNQLPD